MITNRDNKIDAALLNQAAAMAEHKAGEDKLGCFKIKLPPHVDRYSMTGTPGGYREIESDSGEWVRFEDVEKIIA